MKNNPFLSTNTTITCKSCDASNGFSLSSNSNECIAIGNRSIPNLDGWLLVVRQT